MQPTAIGAFDDDDIWFERGRARAVHRALRRDGDITGDEDAPLVALQADHGRAGDVAGREKCSHEARRQGHALAKRNRHKGGQQAVHRDVIEERQLALLLQARLHDVPGILLQDTGQRDGDRGGVNRRLRIALTHQRQCAGMVGVRVSDQNGVNAAGALDLAQVGQLIARQIPMRLRRWAQASVNQQALAANFQQNAAGAHFIGAAQE